MGVAGGPSIPQSGMQLNLDASNKKSNFGGGTTWFDVSGNDRDFTWADEPTYNTRPVVGGYQQPDSIDAAKATGPASNSFEIDSSSGASFVFYCTNDSLTAKSAFKWYMGDGTGTDARGYFAHIPWSDGKIYFDTNGSTSTSSGGGRVNTSTNIGSHVNFFWVHVFTKSADGATMKIYRDGEEVASRTNAGACPTLSDDGATVGGDDVYASGWNAKMGAFLCYNKELSADEVKQITAALRGRDGA
tara:strand:+ start:3082 stop:3816 length:735 start_codon:yes stop_codon:yes gene_type:complete